MIHAPVNADSVANAIPMYKLDHRNLIDNILYSIALTRNLVFLTDDNELVNFIEENGFRRDIIMLPEELRYLEPAP
jgi:hypothetical protein